MDAHGSNVSGARESALAEASYAERDRFRIKRLWLGAFLSAITAVLAVASSAP